MKYQFRINDDDRSFRLHDDWSNAAFDGRQCGHAFYDDLAKTWTFRNDANVWRIPEWNFGAGPAWILAHPWVPGGEGEKAEYMEEEREAAKVTAMIWWLRIIAVWCAAIFGTLITIAAKLN